MTRIKGQLTTADYLPMEEFARLLKGLRQDKLYLWELYCCLSFCTALRSSDVRSLHWSDVLNKNEFFKIEQKTGKSRSVKFNEIAKNKIFELYGLLGCPEKKELIFNNPKTQMPYSLEHINRLLKKLRFRYKLKITSFSTHTFRKTFGRYVYDTFDRSAESLILLNIIFKHSNIETTRTYIGIRQSEIDSVYNSITF